ncbi:DUF7155 family protein [Mycolicibacterium bacteremicum]|uniref:Secreted protein n=1 Tax=Mycolicibacterium bacteremicum TaxID=564198 RepID=A0A1W9Z1X9_MYCBA|nr:hypothetical protein [Mycolicibacterium bacteremicum]MCV7433175.1 hypothetical protein [Mycolicibacterium bacteremicum]ORA06321.1 hypothetical protein BST17_05025 [Mycolicibacterium bacteremicum]
MAFLSNQTRKFVVAGAFAAAVAAAPVLALSTVPDASVEAKPCLAWFGNKEDGHCLSYSNGNGVAVGTPGAGLCGGGICTGPVFPGNTWNTNIPIG